MLVFAASRRCYEPSSREVLKSMLKTENHMQVVRGAVVILVLFGTIVGMNAVAKTSSSPAVQPTRWFIGDFAGSCHVTITEGTTESRAEFRIRAIPDGFSISTILHRAGAATLPFEFRLAANGALSVVDQFGDPISRNEGSCDDRTCVSRFETADARGFTRKRTMQWSSLEHGLSFSYRVESAEPAYGGRPARQFWFSHDCQLTRVP